MTGVAKNAPFASPAYRRLWGIHFATNTAVTIQAVGASWAMVVLKAPPQVVALVQTSASLPLLLLSPVAGAVADSISRSRIMTSAQVMIAAVACILAGASWMGLASPGLLIAGTLATGCALAFNGPAWMASVGDFLPRPALPKAVMYNAVGLNLARSVGPAIGGALIAAAGYATNFAVSMVVAVALIAALSGVRAPRPPAGSGGPSLHRAILAGVRHVASTSDIRAAVARGFLFTGVASVPQALLPLVARDLLEGGAGTFGFLSASFGAGALGGALLGGRLRRWLTSEGVVQCCLTVSAMATLGVALSTSALLSAICFAAAGAAWVVTLANFNVAVQLASDRALVARALSLYQMAVFGGIATGGWLGGHAAARLGTSDALECSAALGLAILLARYWLPLPGSAPEAPNELPPAETI